MGLQKTAALYIRGPLNIPLLSIHPCQDPSKGVRGMENHWMRNRDGFNTSWTVTTVSNLKRRVISWRSINMEYSTRWDGGLIWWTGLGVYWRWKHGVSFYRSFHVVMWEAMSGGHCEEDWRALFVCLLERTMNLFSSRDPQLVWSAEFILVESEKMDSPVNREWCNL